MLMALSSAFSVRKHCFDVTPTPRGEWFHIQTCPKWSFNSERFEIRGGYTVFLDACSQTLMACGAHVLWVRCIQSKHIPFSWNTFVIFSVAIGDMISLTFRNSTALHLNSISLAVQNFFTILSWYFVICV